MNIIPINNCYFKQDRNMNLETLSLKELKDLQDKVAVAIFDFEKR